MPPSPAGDLTSKDTYVVNCSTLLKEHPILERPAVARAAGFKHVEFWWPFDGTPVPSDHAVEKFLATLDEADVKLAGLNFWAGHMACGDRGRLSTPGCSSEFADNADVVAEIGQRTGCTSFNALYGVRQEGFEPTFQDELALDNLRIAAEVVRTFGGTVLLEPVSGVDAYPLKTAEDSVSFIRRARNSGIQNVALLADFYHLAVNGDDIGEIIELHGAEFGHIQIADNPGRGAPGTGDLALFDWLSRSYEAGYSGQVGLEYKQDQHTAFDWLA